MRPFPVRLLTAAVATATAAGSLVATAPAAVAAQEQPLILVEQLVVAAEDRDGYQRQLFGYGIDDDKDGCDTRLEVLIQESSTPPGVSDDCSVTGTWLSYHDGIVHTDAGGVEIDHTVALAEAWDSGAKHWSADRRRAFGNDLELGASLNVLTTSLNRSKQDKDIAAWVPPLESARCRFALDVLQVKHKWDLAVDRAEKAALVAELQRCGSTLVEVPPEAGVPTPGPDPASGDTITGGQVLLAGAWLMSADRSHGLAFQTDGNLVAYGPNDRPLWSSGTYGNPGARFTLQADGNAVVYAASGVVLWHAGTYGNPGARLTVQDDGNVVLYRSNGSAAWYTGWDRTGLNPGEGLTLGQQITSANGRYHLVLQRDGNVVTYGPGGRPLFFTGSYGADSLVLQADGNLVARRGATPVWHSGTWREGRVGLEVQGDGNVVLYRPDGSPSWYSGWDSGARAISPSTGVYLPRATTPPPAPAPPPTTAPRPGDPGNTKNCGDFANQAAAQAWFDTYFGDYGDVARLDGDDNGLACDGYFR